MDQVVLLTTRLVGLVFVVSSMVYSGLSVRPEEVLGQARRARLVAGALLANFIVTPLIAWGLCKLIPIDADYATGLILIGCAAGAPFIPKLAELARENVTLGITLMMILVGGTVGFLPLAIPFVLPGAQVHPWPVARPLLLLILLPLAVGMAVRARWDLAGRRAAPPIKRVSDVSLVVFLLVLVSVNLGALWGAVGSGAIIAAMLLTILAGAAAYALGGPDVGSRRLLAIATAARNIPAALVIAGSAFGDRPRVMVMVLVTSIVSLVMLLAAVRVFRRGRRRGSDAVEPLPGRPERGAPLVETGALGHE